MAKGGGRLAPEDAARLDYWKKYEWAASFADEDLAPWFAWARWPGAVVHREFIDSVVPPRWSVHRQRTAA